MARPGADELVSHVGKVVLPREFQWRYVVLRQSRTPFRNINDIMGHDINETFQRGRAFTHNVRFVKESSCLERFDEKFSDT